VNDLKDPPQAAEFMHKQVKTVSPDMTLGEAVRFLLSHELSNAPVVEAIADEPRLVGFLSERDCLAALSQESFFGNPSPPQSVRTIMRKSPVCVSPDTDVFGLATIFINHDFRHLPVTSDRGELVGIVSRRDVLSAIDKYYRDTNLRSLREHFPPDTHQFIIHRCIMERR
jgi:CBS domain-containing protein